LGEQRDAAEAKLKKAEEENATYRHALSVSVRCEIDQQKARADDAEAALRKANEGDVQRVRDITKFATERDRARERVAEMGKALREIQICCGGLDGISGHDAPEDVWDIATDALRSLRGEK
jgi:uncharacterized Fe-S cluster-containing protein